MSPDEMTAVMKAHKEGKQIQGCRIGTGDYGNAYAPTWDFSRYDYRVKPEPPKPREWWLNINTRNAMPFEIGGTANADLGWIKVREVIEASSVPDGNESR